MQMNCVTFYSYTTLHRDMERAYIFVQLFIAVLNFLCLREMYLTLSRFLAFLIVASRTKMQFLCTWRIESLFGTVLIS